MHEEDQAIIELKSITPTEKRIGKLISKIGMDLVACGTDTTIKNKNGVTIGQIDFIFKDTDEELIVFVEVSKEQDNSRKISTFFSKWSDIDNIGLIYNQFTLPEMNIIRLYCDLTQEAPNTPRASLEHHLKNKCNKMMYLDDIIYFEESHKKIGQSTKNDLYNFLQVEPRITSYPKDAIRFYIGNNVVYSYVDRVYELLRYCYVYRRRRIELGYQRILKADRIGSISRAIQKGQIIAFPNSIIIYSPEKLYKQEVTDKKPKHVKIDVPNYHCACRIIDGQHRLLAFSKLDEVMQKNAFLPIIAFEDIKKEDEMKMFIDINLNQKKIDSNLLLLLKSDSNWEQGSKEYFEKIAVKIALKLNENSPIQQKIYLGTADEKKRTDITLTTLVAVFIKNNLVGGKIHLYQKSDDDIDGPYKEIKKCFELLNRCLDVKSIKYHQFIYGNKGLRILFRYIQVMERNTKCGNIQVEKTLWFSKFCEIIDDPYLSKLLDYYGDGGATAAVDQIILSLKRNNSEVMSKLSSDLRTLKG